MGTIARMPWPVVADKATMANGRARRTAPERPVSVFWGEQHEHLNCILQNARGSAYGAEHCERRSNGGCFWTIVVFASKSGSQPASRDNEKKSNVQKRLGAGSWGWIDGESRGGREGREREKDGRNGPRKEEEQKVGRGRWKDRGSSSNTRLGGVAGWRNAKKKTEKSREGAEKGKESASFFMVEDPETGEKIAVVGYEGMDPSMIKPSDLQWEPAEIIGSGNVSNDTWWDLMEGDRLLPSGGHAAGGISPYADDSNDEDNEDEEDDDDEDENAGTAVWEASLGNEREESSDIIGAYESDTEEEEEEGQEKEEEDMDEDREQDGRWQVQRRRPMGLKVFGRNFTGLRVKSSLLDDRVLEHRSDASDREVQTAVRRLSAEQNEGTFEIGAQVGDSVKGQFTTAVVTSQEQGGKHMDGRKENVEKLEEEAQEERRVRPPPPVDSVEDVGWLLRGNAQTVNHTEGNLSEEGPDDNKDDKNCIHLMPPTLTSSRLNVFESYKESYGHSGDEADEEEEEEDKDEREFLENGSRAQRVDSTLREVKGRGKILLDGLRARILGTGLAEKDPGGDHDSAVECKRESHRNAEGKEGEETHKISRQNASEDEVYRDSESWQSDLPKAKSKNLPLITATPKRQNVDERLANSFFSSESFEDIGASNEATAMLRAMGIIKPSHIQALSYRTVLSGRSCIIADQTGTGKTLAYLAPLVQMLRKEEISGGGRAKPKKPRALVLTPTSELAAQVLHVARGLSSSGIPFRSLAITGGFKWRTQAEGLCAGVELVVATPGRLLQHMEADNVSLGDARCVVIDEADILFDEDSFWEDMSSLKQALRKSVQYVHVTATLSKTIHDELATEYPNSVSILGPGLHRTAIGLQEVLVDCSGGDDRSEESAFLRKKRALVQLVEQRPVSKTIIFCNKIETCRKVENALRRHDRRGASYEVLPYHAALTPDARQQSLARFSSPARGGCCFLVCTDRASRGLDSIDVEHVVLFDFPRDPSEYVRRVGRTARGAGGLGTVFVFVVGKQVSLARKIMARNDRGHPIHDIPPVP